MTAGSSERLSAVLAKFRRGCPDCSDGRPIAAATWGPAFGDLAAAMARLYDLQNGPECHDGMTRYECERPGGPVHLDTEQLGPGKMAETAAVSGRSRFAV